MYGYRDAKTDEIWKSCETIAVCTHQSEQGPRKDAINEVSEVSRCAKIRWR